MHLHMLARGDLRSVDLLMQCLHNFGNTAGLKVNLLKSNVFLAGVDDEVRQQIIDIIGFSTATLPFRYLEITLASAKLRTSDYSMLVSAVSTRMNAWPRHSLSQAGKLELIYAIFQGVECFWLSVLLIPTNIIDGIISICRKFVWHTKYPLISLATICKPKEDGGWGLKNLGSWNKALLTKNLWKIQTKVDSLWIQWINHVYNAQDIWNWTWNKDNSPLTKQLLQIRDTLVTRFGSIQAAMNGLHGWFIEGKGLQSAYKFFVHSIENWPWKPILWKSCIIPKHRFTTWLLSHGKLLTRDRQQYIEDKICSLCCIPEESSAHLLFDCPINLSL